MFHRSPFAISACLVFLAVLIPACSQPPADDYTQALLQARAAKDEVLRTAAGSPVPPDKRAVMVPLAYFPPDPAYRVPASLAPDAQTGRVTQMLTSTGQRRPTQVMGVLQFVLDGQPLKLEAFAEEGSNGQRVFVPFTDATSNRETYGAGRYLDLDRTATGVYVIDFNTAYNPYCAYNPTYDCPVPPPQNRLPVAIRAGEKIPRGY